jgi:hypothetical protein
VQVQDAAIEAFASLMQLLPEHQHSDLTVPAIGDVCARAKDGDRRAAAARAAAGVAVQLPAGRSAAHNLLFDILDMQRDSIVCVREVLSCELFPLFV